MSKILNLTPHPIVLLRGDEKRVIESAGQVRLAAVTVGAGSIETPDGVVALTKTVFGEPKGLPAPEEDTYYIVSQLIKSALPEREDLLVPAEVVRDETGNITGCKSLGV